MTLFAVLKAGLAGFRKQALTVYFVARDPRTPWGVRLLALFIAAYALSPVDLIPDFIPLLGYLDDAVLIPLGLWLVVRLTPPEVLAAAGEKAAQVLRKPVSWFAGACIVLFWLVVGVLLLRAVWRWLAGGP